MKNSCVELLPEICDIARAAGGEILAVHRSDFDVDYKDDKSPVTIADLKADRLITTRLQQLTPQLPVLSEESSANHAYDVRAQWSSYWLVDPLDGTRGFILKNGFYTVNIALISNHRSVLGVIFVPASDTLYYAAQGHGAFRQGRGEDARAIHVQTTPRARPAIAVSRAHINKPTTQLLEQIGDHELVRADSSLKCCLVAEGKADLYLRIGPTSEWDTAAGQCIVEEAGGKLTDCSGKPFTYNTRKSLINPSFVVHTPASPAWRKFVEA